MATRKAKLITNKADIDFLLGIKEEDVTLSFMMDTFGEFDGKRRFEAFDEFDVPPNSFGPEGKRNKNTFHATIGQWIFNKYFIEKELLNILGYVSKTITKKAYKDLNTKLSYAIMEDDITIEVLKRFMLKTQKNMPFVSILSPSHTLKMLLCTKEIGKRKDELFKKYKVEIDAGDLITVDEIEKELLAYAEELLDGDPSLDMYNSGARGSFNNNFKNMYVMRGPIKDADPNKGYNIASSNYITGVKKEEYSMMANSLAAGPYARAKKTEIGGYWEKQLLSAFQHVVLDPEGSDCKTDKYINVDFSTSEIEDYIYCYIIQGSQLIEITSKNMDSYRNKKVKIRFSSLCKSKTGICNKCAGNLFYRLGIKNIGMSTPAIASTLKNLSMKSFHTGNMTYTEIDAMKAFSLI